ncbi:MAG TPA: APC family permease, partial [Terracidiphilus sp.]|nr:APC family permease [Terracidiphilus sp.]
QKKMRLVPLVAATYFMVSGGPYGIEDILGGAGYAWAVAILLLLPFFWSLPTALMIGELASAIPADGGFYVWVRRALGPFWGYQESWLSLSASIFDMALYPSIFVLYLGKFSPALTVGWKAYAWSLALVAVCSLWNLRGAPAVGVGSVWLFVLLLAPFVVFVVIGLLKALMLHPAVQWHNSAPHSTGFGSGSAFSIAVLVAMWNYMGWDNASTIAQEVEDPQRNYSRAMIAATLLTAITYILPMSAMALAGLSSTSFSTGDWANAAYTLGGAGFAGTALSLAVIAGGCITGVGMFNALSMSYTRLPMAMAQDGMLPSIFALRNRRRVPWISVLFCGAAWGLALKLPFERLISIDLILYGSSLLLEFVALVVLRIREPQLERPFKAGNLFVACILGAGPAMLIAYALWVSRAEKVVGTTSALLFAVVVGLLGPLLYSLTAVRIFRLRSTAASIADTVQSD